MTKAEIEREELVEILDAYKRGANHALKLILDLKNQGVVDDEVISSYINDMIDDYT